MKERNPKTILLIEDDVGIVEMLQMVLEEEGYRVDTQTRCEEGFCLQWPFPDLILLDLLLTGMDGKTICQQLKSQDATRHIPIIVMSASPNTAQIARDVGADAWITKPFDIERLLALLDTAWWPGYASNSQNASALSW